MRTATRRSPLLRAPTPASATTRAVPFDYRFQFNLEGTPQKTHRASVTVSIEASFTVVSIGYGVAPVVTPLRFGPTIPETSESDRLALREVRFDNLLDNLQLALDASDTFAVDANRPALDTALRTGLRLNERLATLALQGSGATPIDRGSLADLFEIVGPSGREVQFLYALFDEASGREFQSDPILSTAGLGSPDGTRPFRYLAKPITFAPRTTIRMEITELVTHKAELHVALHGYKELAPPNAPAPPRDRPPRRRGR